MTLLATLALGFAERSFRERSVIVTWGDVQERRRGPGNVWFWTEVAPKVDGWAALLRDLSDAGLKDQVSNVFMAPPPPESGDQDAYAPALSRFVHVNVTGTFDGQRHWAAGVHIVHAHFIDGMRGRPGTSPDEFPLCTQRVEVGIGLLDAEAARLLPDHEARHALLEHELTDPTWGPLLRSADRMSRLLTHRSVGLALSGGESWGFAHLAFVHALEYARVPIDMVSGASSGAVLGTCYSIGGVDAMHEFMDKISKQTPMLMASCVTSVFFERWLAKLWNDQKLEDLVLPVATNLQHSCPEPVLSGPAAMANRLSGSFVPSYPSTPTLRGTFVDGAYSSNLPVDVLPPEGMRLIIASNAMSPTPDCTPRPPRIPGRIGLVLSDLNPLRRLSSTYDGALTLAFASGTQSSRGAARTFQAVRTDVSLMDINASVDVEKLAFAQPTLWETVLGIAARLDDVRRPRIVCEALVVPKSTLME